MAILDISQVGYFDLDNLQNDLHIGFGLDIKTRFLSARYTDQAQTQKFFPTKVDELIEPYATAYDAEDDAYIISQGSDLTKQRDKKDSERDALQKEITRTVETFTTLSIFPDKQQAALVIQPVLQKHKINPDGGIEAQTIATDQWIQEHNASSACTAAAETLGLTASIAQLKSINDEVRRLTAARNDERSQQESAALRNAREVTETAYKALILALNAAAIMDDDETRYSQFIAAINETIKYYRQLAEQRKKANAAKRNKDKDDSGDKPKPSPTPTPTPTPDDGGGSDDQGGGGSDDQGGGGSDDQGGGGSDDQGGGGSDDQGGGGGDDPSDGDDY